MFDPTVVQPDAVTASSATWVVTTLAVIGALTTFLTALANLLPKLSPVTLAIARFAMDFRGVVPKAAAKAEAEAQLQGTTTVPQDVVASGLPMASDVKVTTEDASHKP